MSSMIVAGVSWTMGAIVPSLLAIDSDPPLRYVVGQCRAVGGSIRLQYPGIELTGPVSAKFGTWLLTVPGPWKSLVSGTMGYVPMQACPAGDDSVRVRIPAPTAYNRPYGACVVLTSSQLVSLVRYLTKTLEPD